jgi:transcriptional regulator with XRE-family HTH domain
MTSPSPRGIADGRDSDLMRYLAALGERIRLLRLLARLTQSELADAAGISRSFLSAVERGARGLDLVRLRRLERRPGHRLLSAPLPRRQRLAPVAREPELADAGRLPLQPLAAAVRVPMSRSRLLRGTR